MLQERLEAGHRRRFFPEGTCSDGLRVLPFRSTLFAPFLADGLPADFQVQPITLGYTAPEEEATEFNGWWGDMELGRHLLDVLSVRCQGGVRGSYHAPIPVRSVPDRKALALATEQAVRAGLSSAETPSAS